LTENGARVMLGVATASAILGYIAAIAFGLGGDRGAAGYYLVVSVLVSLLAFGFYRRYKSLRDARWQRELEAVGDPAERRAAADVESNAAPGAGSDGTTAG
jgi:hypothetical protein